MTATRRSARRNSRNCVSHQSARYAVGLPDDIQGWLPDQPLPFQPAM